LTKKDFPLLKVIQEFIIYDTNIEFDIDWYIFSGNDENR